MSQEPRSAESPASSLGPAEVEASPAPRDLPGRAVVVGMFAFGLLVVAGFWTYWALYDRPLAPLRDEIAGTLAAAGYDEATVQIAAGRAKRSNVEQLRVVVKTSFDPHDDATAAATVFDLIDASVRDWPRAGSFDELEVVLFDEYAHEREGYWRRVVELGGTRL